MWQLDDLNTFKCVYFFVYRLVLQIMTKVCFLWIHIIEKLERTSYIIIRTNKTRDI